MRVDTSAELNARLLNLIDWVGQPGKEIESGLREQVPELARELIAWGFWGNALEGAAFLVYAVISVMAFRWGVKNAVRLTDEYNNPGGIFAGIFGIVAALFFSVMAFGSISTAVKVKIAPRVYLVETASHWLHQ